MRTGAEALVAALEAEGVTRIYGVPGEENLDLMEAVRRSAIRFVTCRHEQAAGFMAATEGRLTGQAGVCLATLGPGATNLLTAAAHAQLGGMPMVMLTGQKPIKSSKQGLFQILDVVDLMQPVTKYTRQLASATTIPSRVREAFRRAEEERPGAVHLELPEDIARDPCDSALIEPSFVRRPVVEAKAVSRAAELLESAQQPIVLIGAGANRNLVAEALRQFVDRQGIPFATTQMGKGVVDESHTLCIGNAALSNGDFVHAALDCADVIVNVGHDVIEKPPFLMREDGTPKVIHIHHSSAVVDPVYFPQVEMVGDISESVSALNQVTTPQAHWDFSRFECAKGAFQDSRLEQASDERFPMALPRLVSDLRQALPRNGGVALDNGMFKIWFARNFPAYEPNTVLLDNALATMGAGLPTAMAARLLEPDRPVLAVCGDGGFLMNGQELETAVRLGLQLVILVLRDDAYGMIRWKQEEMKLDDFGMSFHNPDFVQFGSSHGAIGHRVESAGELRPLVEHCLAEQGVHLIEVPVDYSDNVEFFAEVIPERIRQMDELPCPSSDPPELE